MGKVFFSPSYSFLRGMYMVHVEAEEKEVDESITPSGQDRTYPRVYFAGHKNKTKKPPSLFVFSLYSLFFALWTKKDLKNRG